MPLATLSLRYVGIRWGDGDLALVEERWWKTRQLRTWRVRPDDPETGVRMEADYSFEGLDIPLSIENGSGLATTLGFILAVILASME